MVDLEDLKAKALAATPGPWYCDEPFVGSSHNSHNIVSGVGDNPISNGHFIAAANPAAVLELIERLESAEAERDALKAELEGAWKQSPSAVYMGEHYIICGAKYYRLILDRKIKDAAKFELYASPVPPSTKQDPCGYQCRFITPTEAWGYCSKEHYETVKAAPHEYPGYEVRAVYASPVPAQQLPDDARYAVDPIHDKGEYYITSKDINAILKGGEND